MRMIRPTVPRSLHVLFVMIVGPMLTGWLCPGPRVAWAEDTVMLKDQTQMVGRVRETGGVWAELVTPSGRRKILKRDIDRIVFDKKRKSATVIERDFVLRKDQHKIYGAIELLLGGEQVQVTLPSGSRVTLPRKDVLRIVRKGETVGEEEGLYTVEFAAALERTFAQLEAESAGERESAERQLIAYGVLAIQDVRARLETATQERVREALARVVRSYRLREVVSPLIASNAQGIFEILESSDGSSKAMSDEKKNLLLFVFPKFTDEAVPLASFLAVDTRQEGVVRAWCIEFLRRLQKNRELVRIYNRSVGQVQLASAIALGKNQILVGVPTLIEALSMENQEIRELASTALREVTGHNFRYRANGAPAARLESLRRWEAWWEENENRLIASSEKLIRADGSETEERAMARRLWKEANALIQENRPQEGVLLLRRCVATDPNFYPGQLGLAVLLYARLEQPKEALSLLENVVNRQVPGVSYADQGWGFLHLGHARRLSGDLDGAVEAYAGCLTRQPKNSDALLASAETELRIADHREGLTPDERRARLRKVRDDLRDGVRLLDERGSQLTPLAAEDLPLVEALPFDRREYNRAVFDVRRSYRLDRAAAAFLFAKVESRIGKSGDAVRELQLALREVAAEKGDEWRELELGMRTFLGILYEGSNRPSLALREFRTVLQTLDPKDEESQRGIRRLRGRSSERERDAPGN